MSKMKFLSLALVLVLCMTMLAACAGGGSSSSAPAPSSSAAAPASSAAPSSAAPASSAPAAPEKVKLSVCRSQTGWGNSIDPDLMEAWKKKLEEATNTEITMIAPPHNDYREKLNVLLTSGEIPDVFRVQLALDTVPLYAVRGYAAPIDEYLDKNEYLKANLGNINPDGFRVQGKLYALPENRPAVKIFLAREDLVKQYGLNLKDEMTTQEFYDEMMKVDQKAVIPFCYPKWTENFQIFYNAFGGYAGIVKDAGGKYIDGFNTQEVKDALLYIKSLYDAGIMDKEFITNENAMMREKFYTGKALSMADYYSNYTQMILQADGVGKVTDLVPVYTLVGPKGDKGNLNEAAQDAQCISPKAKDPQRAMDVIAYMSYSNEGVLLSRVGVEGQHYTLENGVITPTEKAKSSGYALSPGGFTTSIPVFDKLPFTWGGVGDKYFPKQVEIRDKTVAEGTLGPKYTVPSGVSDLFDKNSAGYLQTMKETATKVVLGNATIDQAFSEYTNYWKSIQGDEMLAQLNK